MKVINVYKFSRVFQNKDAIHCEVRYTEGDSAMFGAGIYLNGYLYFNPKAGEIYRVKEKKMGRYPKDLMFQKLYLINTLGGGQSWKNRKW